VACECVGSINFDCERYLSRSCSRFIIKKKRYLLYWQIPLLWEMPEREILRENTHCFASIFFVLFCFVFFVTLSRIWIFFRRRIHLAIFFYFTFLCVGKGNILLSIITIHFNILHWSFYFFLSVSISLSLRCNFFFEGVIKTILRKSFVARIHLFRFKVSTPLRDRDAHMLVTSSHVTYHTRKYLSFCWQKKNEFGVLFFSSFILSQDIRSRTGATNLISLLECAREKNDTTV